MNQSGRQHHGEGGAVFITADIHLAMMQLHDLFDNGQSHAVALGGMGFVRLIELLENAVPFFGRDGAAGVRDSHPDTFRAGLDRHPDQPVFRRELDCVVQQIDPDLLQQLRIGFDLIFVKTQTQIQVLCVPVAGCRSGSAPRD